MIFEKLTKKDSVKELTATQKDDLFSKIILGQDITEVIKTTKGDFKVKFPRMSDIEAIGRLVAFRLNGISVQSIDGYTYNLMSQIATLDTLILSGPAWYENAKKENNFTWGDMPSRDFLNEVYDAVYTFRQRVQEQLEPNKKSESTGLDNTENNSVNDNGKGTFDGLSGKSN